MGKIRLNCINLQYIFIEMNKIKSKIKMNEIQNVYLLVFSKTAFTLFIFTLLLPYIINNLNKISVYQYKGFKH